MYHDCRIIKYELIQGRKIVFHNDIDLKQFIVHIIAIYKKYLRRICKYLILHLFPKPDFLDYFYLVLFYYYIQIHLAKFRILDRCHI